MTQNPSEVLPYQETDTQQTYIGRQPVYDHDFNIFGYELLYRSSEENQATHLDGSLATTQVIMNAFTEIGMDTLVGNHHAFINMTRDFLLGDIPIPFSPENVILEVLEDIEIDEELVTAIKSLSAQGYRFALDDFVFKEHTRPLLDIVDIVKLDVLALDEQTLHKHIKELRQHDVKLLAEKVESQKQFLSCQEMGFELFQGYFFCKPNIVKGSQIPTNRLTTIQLLGKLQDTNIRVKELEQIISQDMAMSYRLLRLINSAFYAMPKKIESIHQAVVYLGNETLKRWASLISLATIDDKPQLLMTTAMIRAKMCELLASNSGENNTDKFFTTGLFSALDALIDMDMENLLAKLPLADDIVEALLFREGPIGEALTCTLAYENWDWDNVYISHYEQETIQCAYIEAVEWAEQTTKSIST